jgi:hypothetical protein
MDSLLPKITQTLFQRPTLMFYVEAKKDSTNTNPNYKAWGVNMKAKKDITVLSRDDLVE